MKRYLSLAAVFGVATALSCGGCKSNNENDQNSDSGFDMSFADVLDMFDMSGGDAGDGAILGSRTTTAPADGVSPDGAADVDSALDGEARAGRITGETGFTGLWSHCKTGDFKLYNGRVEACVSSIQSNRYEMFNGGGLVDMRTVGNETDDVFDLYTPRIGFNTLHASTVEVIRDGGDGRPAVIRAVGTDMPAAYFVGVAGHQLFDVKGVDVTVEYRLGPDSDFIEILTFVENNTGGRVQVQKGDLLAFGDRARVFRKDSGLGNDSAPFRWIAAFGNGHSFAWVTPDEPLESLSASFGNPPWEITQAQAFVLEDGDSYQQFGRMFIGDGELDAVLRKARTELDEPVGVERTVTLVDGDGNPVSGRLVEVFDTADTAVTAGVSGADGTVTLSHPSGTYRYIVAGVPGRAAGSELLQLTDDDVAVELTAPAAGFVAVTVTVDGEEVPASVQAFNNSDRADFVPWRGIHETFQLAPGDWTLAIGKGPEYDYVLEDVTVVEGEIAAVDVTLNRILDTTDWIAGDFHQHMEPSSDSEVRVEDRVLDNLAEGVELITPTDHDVATDLVPYIAELGVQTQVSTFVGAELSPALAHTNVYPIPWDATQPGRGTVPLSVLEDGQPRRRSVPELIADARALATDPVVQVNHPRDSSGLFDLVEFDPEVDPSENTHSWFTTDFDAMELVNGDDCQQFADWSGLWNAGIEPTAIGSSDSHGIWGNSGDARTYIYLPSVEPAAVTADAVRDAVKAGQVVVASSAFLEFTNGTLPGDELDGSSGTVELPVKIQSANWSSVDQIEVVVNGTLTETIPVTSVDSTVDFEGTVSVPVTEDSWVVLLASGPRPSGEYVPSGTRTYAVHTPVRVDFDGGGYTAPGVRALSVDGVVFCN